MNIKNLCIAIVLTGFANCAYAASGYGDLSALLNGGSAADIAQSIIGTSSPSLTQIVGTWKTTGPAVNFKSQDILKSVGGVVAASTIKSQLQPYYTKARLDNLVITISADSKFTIKAPVGSITGTIVKNADKSFSMKFNDFNKIKIGSIKANIQYNSGKIDLTFDIAKLVDLVSKIAAQVDNRSIETVISFLRNYDGIYVGFEFQKTR